MNVEEPETNGAVPRQPPGHRGSFGPAEEAEGWFPGDSMIRRIGQEALTLLGGGRALLLQVAHPLVAAGVADHSDFRTDPLGRLFRTLELMHTLVFASRTRAEQALRRFHAVHARIHGHLALPAGPFPAGTAYSAGDPELKLWVHATLVDTSLMAYDRFVAPLSPDERAHYYADTCVLARMLGVPDRILPPTPGDFQDYTDGMLAGDTLTVTPGSRRLARSVLRPEGVGTALSASMRLIRLVTAGLLPERLRTMYGLEWGVGQQRRFDRFSRTTQILRPWMPAWVWRSPLLDGGLVRRLVWGSAGSSSGSSPCVPRCSGKG